MPTKSHVTIDHDEIRRWAEERGGQPAGVRGTGQGDTTGIIRIDFPGYSGKGKLEPISWDEFFEKFEESHLALVYQDTTARGQRSNFNKLVGRETVDVEQGEGKRVAPPRRARKAASASAAKASVRGAVRAPQAAAARTARAKTAGGGSAAGGGAKRGRAGTPARKSTAKRTSARKSPRK